MRPLAYVRWRTRAAVRFHFGTVPTTGGPQLVAASSFLQFHTSTRSKSSILNLVVKEDDFCRKDHKERKSFVDFVSFWSTDLIAEATTSP